MTVHCFTSFNFSYLSKARVFASSLRKHHPDWYILAVISDREPEGFAFEIQNEDFDQVIWTDELFGDDTPSWMFKHDIVELCTAVKGPVLKKLVDSGANKIFYLDPDIVVFESLQPLVDALDEASILLTPHQIDPDSSHRAINDNEMCSLRHGVYNLGFLAIRNDDDGRRFANWWSDRLKYFCYDDIPNGLFVDQRWCDLIPALFDNVAVIRDPGYNVASWNLSNRHLDITRKGEILVNHRPLRFYHFTKLGPIGDLMTQRYAGDNVEVYEIWTWYRFEVERLTDPSIPNKWWHFGTFDNGEEIPKNLRVLFRNREDLQQAFSAPFAAGPGTLLEWYKNMRVGA